MIAAIVPRPTEPEPCAICDQTTGTHCKYCGMPLCWWCLFCGRDTYAHDATTVHPESALV